MAILNIEFYPWPKMKDEAIITTITWEICDTVISAHILLVCISCDIPVWFVPMGIVIIQALLMDFYKYLFSDSRFKWVNSSAHFEWNLGG